MSYIPISEAIHRWILRPTDSNELCCLKLLRRRRLISETELNLAAHARSKSAKVLLGKDSVEEIAFSWQSWLEELEQIDQHYFMSSLLVLGRMVADSDESETILSKLDLWFQFDDEKRLIEAHEFSIMNNSRVSVIMNSRNHNNKSSRTWFSFLLIDVASCFQFSKTNNLHEKPIDCSSDFYDCLNDLSTLLPSLHLDLMDKITRKLVKNRIRSLHHSESD